MTPLLIALLAAPASAESGGYTYGYYGRESFCFVADTPVQTPAGAVPIQGLEVGDTVLSWSFRAERLVPREVLEVHSHRERRFVGIRAGEQEVWGVTPHHPFWSPEEADWVEAGSLEAGDTVAVVGERGALTAVEIDAVQLWTEAAVPVYTLTVAGEENFVAGSFLVHNKSLPPQQQGCGRFFNARPSIEDDGCGCATGARPEGWMLLAIGALAWRRRETDP